MTATWEPYELTFAADGTYENGHTDVALTARFEHESGETRDVPGFWDGGDTWRVRFAPPRPGEWSWETETDVDDAGLERRGAFGVTPASGEGRLREHGFLVAEGRELRHADGEPFFWLGDTVWSAGAKATTDEWERYVDYRAEQGYTVAQINALPQHDASTPQNRIPFADWDLDRPDPDYFRAVDDLVATCHDRGIVPALVALWYDYVRGENPDWGTADDSRHPFDPPEARRFGRYLGARYGAYGTVWLVSGDAEFAEGTLDVYESLVAGLRETSPEPLCTVHMPGGATTPEPVIEADWFDFHCYQSSHVSNLERPARQAEEIRSADPGRPIVNGEPPYEGHGLFDDREERITRELARRAAWISLLAGANAGVTYGGHGLWQWHRYGETNVQAAGKGRPDSWEDALTLPGARDYAHVRSFFERFDYGGLEPRQDLLADDDPTVRAAELPEDDVVLAYTPRDESIEFAAGVLDDRTVSWRHAATGETFDAAVDGNEVEAPPFLDDGLLIVR